MRNNESKKLVIRGEKSNRSSLSTIYQDAQRCSKMTESLQQINKWIDGSSKCAENRNEEKKTYFMKSSCLEDALKMPRYEYCCSIVN